MYRNYFLFEKQLKEIAPDLIGSEILESCSVNRNELLIRLKREEELFLKISIDINLPYFYLRNAHGIKQPKFRLFEQIEGTCIQKVNIQPLDKKIDIDLKTYHLDIRFYGKTPNIFLKDTTGKVLHTFKREQNGTIGNADSSLMDFRTVHFDDLQQIIDQEPTQKICFLLKRRFGAINRTLTNEIVYRLQIDKNALLATLSRTQIRKLADIFRQLGAELLAKESYIYFGEDGSLHLAPLILSYLAEKRGTKVKQFDSLNRAWKYFIEEKQRLTTFLPLYKQCELALQGRQKYLQKSLKQLQQLEDLVRLKQEAEQKGNLLLTFQNRVPRGASQVELENIFGDPSRKITIKLNPAKSAVENAQKYFNKYKNIEEKQEALTIRKQTLKKALDTITQLGEQLKKMRSLNKLRNFHRKLIAMKLVQTDRPADKKNATSAYSFNRIILDNEWDVFIGKNGANNEQLTFEFAHKWDLWFHAQGVPGSHVVIRLPRHDFHPPKGIIEQAARIAAANSRAKHSKTIPVIYTEVRFVHRMRKALPGTVSVKNEKVLFVEPLFI